MKQKNVRRRAAREGEQRARHRKRRPKTICADLTFVDMGQNRRAAKLMGSLLEGLDKIR